MQRHVAGALLAVIASPRGAGCAGALLWCRKMGFEPMHDVPLMTSGMGSELSSAVGFTRLRPTRSRLVRRRGCRSRSTSTRRPGSCPAKPYPSVEGIKSMMEIYNYREMRVHQPDDFYDASFVSELDKSGYIDGLYRK